MEPETHQRKTLEEEDSWDLKAVEAIVNVFTEEKYESDRLKVLQGFRLIFTKCVPTLENKLFQGLSVEALFDVITSIDKESSLGSNDSEFEYFIFLLRLMNYDQKFHDKVKKEFSKCVKLLLKEHETLPDFLVRNIWYTFEKNSIIWPDLVQDIVASSDIFIENKVFEWVNEYADNFEMSNIKYYAEVSAKCKDLFQKITAMLDKILWLTQGNENILSFISHFVNLVSENCDIHGGTIVRLYPREYCQLISLLVIPPDIYFDVESNIYNENDLKSEVLQLLLTNFKNDKNFTLMILTHYPKWLKEFFVFLNPINKNEKK